jgi:hypothetical protein
MGKKLNQVIAAEAAVKGTVTEKITKLYQLNQKPDLFEGVQKEYKPLKDDDERLAPEGKRVQVRAEEQIAQAAVAWEELMSLAYTKDQANTTAFADVVVRGQTLLKNVPVTFLLFLEKRLIDMQTFVNVLPVLDEAHSWTPDENQGLFRSETMKTHRTLKKQRPIVLYESTKEHAAQTQLITEDVVSGHYETVRTSGALTHPRKRELLARCHELILAVKEAREHANLAEVTTLSAKPVLDFLFAN